jgi:hypothetical protein
MQDFSSFGYGNAHGKRGNLEIHVNCGGVHCRRPLKLTCIIIADNKYIGSPEIHEIQGRSRVGALKIPSSRLEQKSLWRLWKEGRVAVRVGRTP